ncbi:LuxR C-terminal-related transcriptional regulator [Streptomyces griseoruber]|uniref:LuxR family transcriptional regulator n=1 Tax=Streptomyces griseoruber TaxID=1943 RepID=A0A101T016_9ACTN|nr:response regulator transcription factor [Streptomyces griseoruber]KUN83290.1 LuxR family transcriptional regulator [Streptomyces griseoruber]
MASILIVNDQSLQRLGLRMLLTAEPDLTVVGEAATGAEAVRLSAALRPDVVLMATPPRDAAGIEAVRRITRPVRLLPDASDSARADRLPPRVLVLASTSHEGHVYAALRAGAGGFLRDSAGPDQLIAAIRIVAAGDAVITPDLTRELIDSVRQQRTPRPLEQHTRPDAFTGRERDVLLAVASGWSNAEIAARLSIAPTTVKSHITHILAKIHARSRVQVVTYAYESGLVRPAA